MHIGLYDIDLWHGGRNPPNFDLMKYYNYYYRQRIKVSMVNPKDDFGRFSQIFFFKESAIEVPAKLDLTASNVSFSGKGFYKNRPVLPPEIRQTPPSFLPYDIYSEKIASKRKYEMMRKSSIIRLEDEDLTGMIDSKIIYVIDKNPLIYDLEKFLLMFPNKFDFYYSLEVSTPSQLSAYDKYTDRFARPLFINFPYNYEFFLNNFEKHYSFSYYRQEGESETDSLIKLTKMIITLKTKKKCLFKNVCIDEFDPIRRHLLVWGRSASTLSFKEFFANDGAAQSIIITSPARLRYLLAMNPKECLSKGIDFLVKL